MRANLMQTLSQIEIEQVSGGAALGSVGGMLDGLGLGNILGGLGLDNLLGGLLGGESGLNLGGIADVLAADVALTGAYLSTVVGSVGDIADNL